MFNLFPKFIIQGESLILGMVSYHSELVDKENSDKVKGGGWFRWNVDKTMITFHGGSHDYGAASMEDIKSCVDTGNIFSGAIGRPSPLRNRGFAYRDADNEIFILKEPDSQ
jgi:hypothetical protein